MQPAGLERLWPHLQPVIDRQRQKLDDRARLAAALRKFPTAERVTLELDANDTQPLGKTPRRHQRPDCACYECRPWRIWTSQVWVGHKIGAHVYRLTGDLIRQLVLTGRGSLSTRDGVVYNFPRWLLEPGVKAGLDDRGGSTAQSVAVGNERLPLRQ